MVKNTEYDNEDLDNLTVVADSYDLWLSDVITDIEIKKFSKTISEHDYWSCYHQLVAQKLYPRTAMR